MGYTHYWRSVGLVLDEASFADFKEDVKKITETAQEAGIGLVEDYTDNEIIINGIAENGHETFVFSRTPEPFEFCKTNGKPYDMVVVATLIHAKKMFKAFKISSDGNWADWEGGRLLYESVFNVEPKEDEVFK